MASKLLFKNKDYVYFVTGSAIALGSITGGLLVNMSFFVKPFGFKDSDTSDLIAVIPFTGGIGIYLA